MHKIELDFEQARTRHLLFRTKLKSILYGAEMDVHSIISPIDSKIGQWIYAHALKLYGHIPEMIELERIHKYIHESAEQLILQYHSGQANEARNSLHKLESSADTFTEFLTIIEKKVKEDNLNFPYDSEDLIHTNYKELLELRQSITDLDQRIKEQTEELFLSKKFFERKLHNHFSQAPIAICILRGKSFIFEFANDLFLELIDKKADLIGKKLFEALPELQSQNVAELLNGVIHSGKPFIGNELEYSLQRNNILQPGFFNFIIKSLEDELDPSPGLMIVCSEVTEQVLSKDTAMENQRKLNIAIESANLGTYELNLKTGAINYSDRHIAIFGFSPDERPSHEELVKHVHPDDMHIRNEAHRTSLQTGSLSYQLRIVWNDQSIHWIQTSGKVFFDKHGAAEKIMGTVMDITESKTAEEKIRQSNERLEIAMKAGNLGSYELNYETGEVAFDDICKLHFDFPLDMHVTMDDIRHATHPDDRMELQLKMQHIRSNTGNYSAEYRIITKDNELRWISTSGKGIYHKDGTLIKLIGVAENITARKRDEEELSLSLSKFRLLADSMPQFVWTSDTEGNLNYFNQSVFDYTGLTPKQVYEEGWLQIVHPDDRAVNIEKWMHSIRTGENFLYEHRFKKNTGEYRWQLSRALPQRNKAGEIQMWVGTSTDIQDQKTMAQYLEALIIERTKELKNANQELENMNQELRSFTYISSHDLQEPLRKIQTFISRIQETDSQTLSQEGAIYFERIRQAAHKMKTLINDLLTYSRTNVSDKIFETTNLNVLLQEIKTEFTDSLKEKQGTLEIANLPDVQGIPFQLRQLFINLISNSIKFAKPGVPPVIKISASLLMGNDIGNPNAHENELYHQIAISDNGIGFDPEYKSKIFEVFQRLHAKTEFDGTGIGLSICNKIAQNHHGFITAHGELNKGAVFTLYLPFGK
ncbi:MAG: PAS domain-containing protein [Cytophaga sp.]|uniref:PAS domain-containing protein n=1 Tax=Cytophaga sp. TaxID=29535 RepID=UPI003F7DAD8F